MARHTGLSLLGTAAVPEVVASFSCAGFRVPPFMDGEGMASDTEGVNLLYFDRGDDHERQRIEVMWPVDRTGAR